MSNVLTLYRNSYTTCTIHLFGAHITSWRIKNAENLFLSTTTNYTPGVPRLGGIDLVFPRCGPWSFGPFDGFAYRTLWELTENPHKLETGDISTTLTLRDNDWTRSMWNYNFQIDLTITLSEYALEFDVKVTNTGCCSKLYFDLLLGAFFLLDDVEQCEFSDFGRWKHYRLSYMHEVHHKPSFILQSGDVKLKIDKWKMPDVHIWNPGDAEDYIDEYKYYVAIGLGNTGNNKLVLDIGKSYDFKVKFTDIDKMEKARCRCEDIHFSDLMPDAPNIDEA